MVIERDALDILVEKSRKRVYNQDVHLAKSKYYREWIYLMETKYVIFRTNKRSYRITTTNKLWFGLVYMIAVIHSKLFPLKPICDEDFPEGTPVA